LHQSAGIALGMLRVGAKGATADQLIEALGFHRAFNREIAGGFSSS
jgi:hypothetical protein